MSKKSHIEHNPKGELSGAGTHTLQVQQWDSPFTRAAAENVDYATLAADKSDWSRSLKILLGSVLLGTALVNGSSRIEDGYTGVTADQTVTQQSSDTEQYAQSMETKSFTDADDPGDAFKIILQDIEHLPASINLGLGIVEVAGALLLCGRKMRSKDEPGF